MREWLGQFQSLAGDISGQAKSAVKAIDSNRQVTSDDPEFLALQLNRLRRVTGLFRVVGRGVAGSLPKGYSITILNDGVVQPVDVVDVVDTV
jgi:hypothetical protein